ncbi:ABC transporter permease [Microlunatus endophyticus]|uniref:ABC transporter permease n=2 Tax=Microlunatus endophyticus TaxID=1716077 RepID=A0A917SCQ0_9ACTN|nr:ABC transporter permease [Microlunatus endophyticus]
MIAVACLVGLPFYYIVVNTLKTPEQSGRSPLGLPTKLYTENYTGVFHTIPIVQSFLNTVYVTAAAVALMLLIGSLAAFGMVLSKARLTRLLGAALLIGFVVPFQTTLIPLYQDLAKAHLVDSLNGLIVIYAAGAIFCYFLIQGYMRTIPNEIIEAARIDGAGPFRIYWSIMLPLIRPILVTVGVFQTMWVWNDFLTPQVFISSPTKSTLVLQVYTAVGEFAVNWPLFMTMTVIVLVPMVIFFLLMQRHIVSGLVSGGVKV